MIKIKFLENNTFLVRNNGGIKSFNKYINIIYSKLLYCAKPNFKDKSGGWIFHYNKLEEVKQAFNDIEYENEYIEPPYKNIGSDMKLQPYDYQKEAIHFAINNENALLVLPCGAGKTVIGIGVYNEALKNNIIKGQGLIIVKASLKTQWKKEISKFSDYSSHIIQTYSDCTSSHMRKIKTIENKIKKTKNEKEIKGYKSIIEELNTIANNDFNNQFENVDLLIANYETLLDEKVLNKLIDKNIECIICDEIHFCKTHTAARSKALYKLNKAKVKVGATATPITKDPRDVFGIFKFIKQDLFNKVGEFQKRYINYAGYGRINGFKNQDELKDKIKNNIFVKTKRDIASQLPQTICLPMYIDITDEQLYVHDKIMKELDELNHKDFNIRMSCKSEQEALLNPELQQINGKVMALQTFAQELTDSPLLLMDSESDYSKTFAEGLNLDINPKLDMCLDLIETIIESGEKVCIFSKFERMQPILTDAINKRFNSKKDNIGVSYINGSLSSEQRYIEAYDKFRDNEYYKVLLCSDAGAEGLNLSKCKYLIEYDLANSYAIQTQRQGRVERADSIHSSVFVYQLIANDSWDTIQQKIINKKQGFDNDIIKSLAK